MKPLFLFLCLYSLSIYGQKPPAVHFNHLFFVIDSADLAALRNSSFIKNKLAALIVRTTKVDDRTTWTGTYLEGLDNYIEIFDSAGVGLPTGYAGIGLGVDSVGELAQMNTILSKKYTTDTWLREKQDGDKKIPWFNNLQITDSAFDSLSHFSFWVMEYRKEYYDYNHWQYKNNKLTRATYLKQFAKERQNKLLKRFTGLTLKVTGPERQMLSGFMLSCGYRQINDNDFTSPDNFQIHLINRNENDRAVVVSIEFEINKAENENVVISENVEVKLHDKSGVIVFK